jgi:lipopolysaccharide transport system ATP-binding protein
MAETLVKVENLSKKFCRNLKRSLWYGIKDIGSELTGSSKKNIKLRKEEFWALKDVSFELKKGELMGLIGANGAGKTTILKLLTGLIKPDKGIITIQGKIQALIALGAGFNPVLTARENIYINGAVLGLKKKEIESMIEEIMEFSEIGEFIDMPVQSYSSGMHVRLGFAVAVNLKPDILIVDEVLAVGDASFRRKARNKMMELLHSGISVLFVSHNMATVNSLTSRCIYLKKGEVAAIGPSEEITSLYLSDSIKKNKMAPDTTGDNYMDSAYLSIPGVFVLKEVRLFNGSGEGTTEFNSYENIRLFFDMEFKETLKNIAFALSIRTQIDDVVVGFSRVIPGYDGYHGALTVECDIERNTLREGVYNIGFYVSGADGGALFKSNSVKTFTILADMGIIKNSGSSQGLVILDTSWKVV